MNIEQLVKSQREYFLKGNTLDIRKRKETLIQVRELLLKYRSKFVEAFKIDYNKCEFDVLSTEFLLVMQECDYMIKHIGSLTKTRRVSTSIVNFPSHGYLMQEPYGVVLIMAPWNYPLQLALEPLMGAIAAGNTVILKPASYAANVSNVIYEMFQELDSRLVSVVLGGREQNQALLDQRFDYIFFTGSENVGRIVLEKAAKWLTPVSLELGGKSPTIVDEDADIDLAAKRIVWGKFLNAGQTCVAPDFVCIHASIHKIFVEKVIEYTKRFYYQNNELKDDFPNLINEKHASKVLPLIDLNKIVFGGKNKGTRLEPTILDNVSWDDPVMQIEIFGPILPIIEFYDINALLDILVLKEKPLAFYYFSKNKKKAKRIMKYSSFGGGCINETIMHLTNDKLPFGGVGKSGMGSYHAKKSFETFSHQKSVLAKGKLELPLRYQPYTPFAMKMIKFLSKIKDKK